MKNVYKISGSDGLWSYSSQTRQFSEIRITPTPNVLRVAFDTRTDTLLLLQLVLHADDAPYYEELRLNDYYLVALGQDKNTSTSKWTEIHRLKVDLLVDDAEPDLTAFNSLIFLGGGYERKLYLFGVTPEHRLHLHSYDTVPHKFYGLACTRLGKDMLVAFAHERSVSLHRLVSDFPLKFEQRNVVFIGAPRRLLFCKDLLLVSDWKWITRSHNILSLRASGGALVEQQMLFETERAGADYRHLSWAFVGNKLILFHWDTISDYQFANEFD